jgi:two-component system, chemotaxis family, CheB/CheR fusion protein
MTADDRNGEFEALLKSFFRDDIAWKFLADEIVPRIVQVREREGIRVWSAGCATGEDGYTLAIIFAEALGDDLFRRRVKIYATDVDDEELNVGRHARYTTKHLASIPEKLRNAYFEQTNGTWTFRPDLRRSVIFGRHDLVQDPPISHIDLLVARNTLMDFDTPTQEQILQNFHFALRDDGYLALAKSEALAARTSFFAPIDLKRRVFAKVPRPIGRQRLALAPEGVPPERIGPGRDLVRDAAFDAVPIAQLTISVDGELLATNLQARALFGLRQRDVGRPFRDLEVSFRPVELRSRINQVLAEGHPAALREVEWQTPADTRYLDVHISPLVATTGETVGVGVSFADVTRYRRLQEELQESRREGETAYEELQSTNKELETVNDELNLRTDDLNRTKAFLDALLSALDAGVAVVDRDLEVQAWNRGARELWGLTADETVGRHFLGLDIGLPLDRLRSEIRNAVAEGDGQPRHLRLRAINRRGRPIDCAVTLTPLEGPIGDGHGLIVMMQTVDSLDS